MSFLGVYSLDNLLYSIDPATVTYGLLFFIFFTVLFMILTRVSLFQTNKRNAYGMPQSEVNTTAAAIVAFSISALMVYSFYRNNYSLDSLFGGIGIQTDIFNSFLPIILLGFVAFIFYLFGRTTVETHRGEEKRWSFFKALAILSLILGLGIILAVIFTDIFYDKVLPLFIGIILVVIGIFSWKKSARTWLRNHRPTTY